MTQEQFIESFDFENSEWAREWMEKNGKINTIEMTYKYMKETFDDPFEYLFEHITDSLK